MTSEMILAVIGVILTIISVGIVFLTFWFSRKKDSSEVGEWRGELKSDINHIKAGVDELRLDTRGIKTDVQDLRERVIKVEASTKAAHHRLDQIQGKESNNVD